MSTPPVPLELFPELPAPVPVPRPRNRRAASAKPGPVPNVAQASLETALAGGPPPADDAEALARRLEAHADYRVQRRLKPVLDWPGTAQGPVCRVIVLDTETTGLDASRERIIELALLRVDIDIASGRPVGPVAVYDGLEDPGKPIPAEVVALTGIRDADVRGQHLDDARVAAMLADADLVIAHNAGFDRPFVEARYGGFAQLPWACSFADIDWKAQGRSSAKLESLALAHGWFYDAHRAEMDCHALLAVLAQALGQVPGVAGEGAGEVATGMGLLLAAAQRPSYALQATQAPFEAKDKLKGRGYRWNAEQRVWHTRLKGDAELNAEFSWLKEQVYGLRRALVQIEKLDARVRFSSRAGAISHIEL